MAVRRLQHGRRGRRCRRNQHRCPDGEARARWGAGCRGRRGGGCGRWGLEGNGTECVSAAQELRAPLQGDTYTSRRGRCATAGRWRRRGARRARRAAAPGAGSGGLGRKTTCRRSRCHTFAVDAPDVEGLGAGEAVLQQARPRRVGTVVGQGGIQDRVA